ncbi:hypothetical protein [Salinispora arenicola]|uniref:hypothetical protein n=1 Tax=Salinispora arenicola TaxID=168697 RepID=UPI00169E0BE8|nr:hypothetical protein [Salinispora arenicola]NIL56225.1 hypothetical protein [Salinispora arenicola]NIL62144.1 hypothetical protein [Salinispora arenicola]
MSWEDRTPDEKKKARTAARRRQATDDTHLYLVTTGKGTRLTAKGINSARVLTGKHGTYHRI